MHGWSPLQCVPACTSRAHKPVRLLLPQLPSARGIAAAAPLRAREVLGKAQWHLALISPRAEQAVSFGYFSLGQQRKVTRAPSGDRKPAAGEPSRVEPTLGQPERLTKPSGRMGVPGAQRCVRTYQRQKKKAPHEAGLSPAQR